MMAGPLKIDVEDFTIEELETIEDLTGRPITVLFPANGATATGLRGAVFVLKRREDPGFTWDDAAQLKINDLDLEPKPDPTTAAAD